MKHPIHKLILALAFIATANLALADQADKLKIFISVDMEGIGGVGTPKMTSSNGKDYGTARQLMTDEVNAVVTAIYEFGDAEVLVNDSHGDMQNLLHIQLDPRVEYLQSNIKPLGMVQGLDASFDAVIFIGYHTRAGTRDGFLAHTGSGSVKGLWLNNVEVGEGGLNAYFAGALGVPVILASGDKAFAEQFKALVPARTVATKESIGSSAAKMLHPDVVKKMLADETKTALQNLKSAKAIDAAGLVTFRIKFNTTTRADVTMAVPGVKRLDGYTIEYNAESMDQAYRLIRLFYKYVSW